MQGVKGLKGLITRTKEQRENAVTFAKRKLQVMVTCCTGWWKLASGT